VWHLRAYPGDAVGGALPGARGAALFWVEVN
jgi:hypothetical protein